MLTILESHHGGDTSPAHSTFCLQALREPLSLLSSIEPHLLNASAWPIQSGFSSKQHQCTVYVKDVTSGAGLNTLVNSVQ